MTEVKNEIKFDGRDLPPAAQEELRRRAVAAVQRGHSPELVSDIFGVHRSSLYQWLARFEEGGEEALKSLPHPGRPRQDTAEIRALLKDLVLDTTPQKWGYETALWTRGILAELLQRLKGVRVTEQTVGNWLHELGLSPQVPLWRAEDQDPESVRRFKEEKFPAIRRLAAKLGAEIWFIDECGYHSQDHAGRTWGVTGQTPIVHTSGKNFRWNVISAVSLQGQLRFKVVEGTVDGAVFYEFVRTLVESSERPVILIVDRHPAHTPAWIRAERKTWRQQFKLFRLPSYSPELNPVEQVPNELKNQAVGKQPFKNKSDLKAKLVWALLNLQRKVQRVCSFFQTPDTKYIFDYV